jgi:hypothetical protein
MEPYVMPASGADACNTLEAGKSHQIEKGQSPEVSTPD